MKAEIGTGKTGQGWLLRKRLNEYEPECCENRKVSRQVALNVKALYSLLFAHALTIIRPSRDLILEKKHSVTKEMKTGADSDEVADELVNTLLNSGNLTFGGTMSSDRSGRGTSKRKTSSKKSQMRKVDMSAARSRK